MLITHNGELTDHTSRQCVPVLLSLQQCCGSVSALRYGWDLFADPTVRNVVLASFDFAREDSDRLRPFALFGDAVTSFLISRDAGFGLRLVSSAVQVDHSGLLGRDSFASRQQVARAALARVERESGTSVAEVTKVFPTNLYQPLNFFNAMASGISKEKLHFTSTLRRNAHCGNCDWTINLVDYQRRVGSRAGQTYLAQASAPGVFACALLQEDE